jgi:prevent-host-death family protein
MKYISATDAKRIGELLDEVQREPITIRRQNRDIAVVVSAADYAQLRGANIAEFQRFCDEVARSAQARGLTEEKLAEILSDEKD